MYLVNTYRQTAGVPARSSQAEFLEDVISSAYNNGLRGRRRLTSNIAKKYLVATIQETCLMLLKGLTVWCKRISPFLISNTDRGFNSQHAHVLFFSAKLGTERNTKTFMLSLSRVTMSHK